MPQTSYAALSVPMPWCGSWRPLGGGTFGQGLPTDAPPHHGALAAWGSLDPIDPADPTCVRPVARRHLAVVPGDGFAGTLRSPAAGLQGVYLDPWRCFIEIKNTYHVAQRTGHGAFPESCVEFLSVS